MTFSYLCPRPRDHLKNRVLRLILVDPEQLWHHPRLEMNRRFLDLSYLKRKPSSDIPVSLDLQQSANTQI